MSALYNLCLIACHGGPAHHFATFAEILEGGVDMQVLAHPLPKRRCRLAMSWAGPRKGQPGVDQSPCKAKCEADSRT